MLVASFSAKVLKSGDSDGQRTGWVPHPYLDQVYVPAPKRTGSLQMQALAAARAARRAAVAAAGT